MTPHNRAQCPSCGAASADGGLCTRETQQFQQHLLEVGWLLRELEAALTRQTKYTARVGSRGTSTALPVDLDAGKAAAAVTAHVLALASDHGAGDVEPALRAAEFAVSRADAAVATYRKAGADELRREAEADLKTALERATILRRQAILLRRGVEGAAVWLARQTPALRLHEDVVIELDNLKELLETSWEAADRPAVRIPLGPCGASVPTGDGDMCHCSCHTGASDTEHRPGCDLVGGCSSTGCRYGWRPGPPAKCQAALTAQPGEDVIKCWLCGTQHEVRTRRDAVLEGVEHFQGTTEQIAGLLTLVELKCSPSMIRNYHDRGRITPTRTDDDGRQWWRFGDVRQAWEDAQAGRPVPKSREPGDGDDTAEEPPATPSTVDDREDTPA